MSTAYVAKAIAGTARRGPARGWIGGIGVGLIVGGAIAAAALLTIARDAAPVEAPLARPETAGVSAAAPVTAADGFVIEGLQGYEWRATVAPALDGFVVEGLQGYEFIRRTAAVPASTATFDGSVTEGLQGYEWRSAISPEAEGTIVEGLQGYQVVPRIAIAPASVPTRDGFVVEGLQGYEWRLTPPR